LKIPIDQSRKTLKLVAGVIWFSGGIVLLLKGSSLLIQADALRPGGQWIWLAIPAGLLIGGIKTELIFEKACHRNLDRISMLDEPKIWLAYRPGFYLFLAAMIVLGGTLSRLAEGNYGGLMAMAVLDFSLATALLGSGRLFWTHRQKHRPKPDDKE
jgi:hypothetical protein